jgi:prepilin-type processing-associated H-X9-DG protein
MKVFYWWASFDNITQQRNDTEGLLYPYMRNHEIQVCPSFRNDLRVTLGLTGYGYNYFYLCPFQQFGPTTFVVSPVSLAAVNTPAETVFMADSARWNLRTNPPRLEGNTFMDPPSRATPTFHGRHTDTGNVLWVDGHAKAVRPQYRSGIFGAGYDAATMKTQRLGDIDRDGDFSTDELWDLQ